MDEMEESARQERRASNMIWTAARDHAFRSGYRAYDAQGRAEPYLNCVIGAVRRWYDWPRLEKLLDELRGFPQGEELTELLWLGLEQCAWEKERASRPALDPLRQAYARKMLAGARPAREQEEEERLAAAHWNAALGRAVPLSEREAAIAAGLDFGPEADAAGIAERMEALARAYFLPGMGEAGKKRRWKLPAWLNFGLNDAQGGFFSAIRRNEGLEGDESDPRRRPSRRTRHTLGSGGASGGARDRAYVADCFGASCVSPRELRDTEKLLCSGSHRGCFLHFTRGEYGPAGTAARDAEIQRSAAVRQREKNRADYRAHRARNELEIHRLSERIRNALLVRQDDDEVRAADGRLAAARVWRGVWLGDGRVFTRIRRGDDPELTVDLLLDASASQLYRQETVAAQGYIIAEALTRCGIPVRVCSFCTAGSCTVTHLFRGYDEPQRNDSIFDYAAAGWNRDGLALRVMGQLMRASRAERKLLIVLSDASPNDDRRLGDAGGALGRAYRGESGVADTAAEAQRLRKEGISLVCVYTGEDRDLPNARRIYGGGLARIRSAGEFADAVGGVVLRALRAE